jgi:tRNA A58 N-methylase Trm61
MEGPKAIFIETVLNKDGTTTTYVDWTKNFKTMDEVLAQLMMAQSSVIETAKKQMAMNTRPLVQRPDFVERRKD